MRLGQHMTDESKAKISVANTGRILSAEVRLKNSVARKGKPKSAEWRANLSVAMMGRPGRPNSPEARARMSIAKKGKTGIESNNWQGGPQVSGPKHNAKRRTLGFVPLNAPFAGCEGHHVDNEQIINMPAALHKSVYHNQTTGQGMAQMNAIAYNFLFKQEVEAAIVQGIHV